jgi:hypothetical protein
MSKSGWLDRYFDKSLGLLDGARRAWKNSFKRRKAGKAQKKNPQLDGG